MLRSYLHLSTIFVRFIEANKSREQSDPGDLTLGVLQRAWHRELRVHFRARQKAAIFHERQRGCLSASLLFPALS